MFIYVKYLLKFVCTQLSKVESFKMIFSHNKDNIIIKMTSICMVQTCIHTSMHYKITFNNCRTVRQTLNLNRLKCISRYYCIYLIVISFPQFLQLKLICIISNISKDMFLYLGPLHRIFQAGKFTKRIESQISSLVI